MKHQHCSADHISLPQGGGPAQLLVLGIPQGQRGPHLNPGIPTHLPDEVAHSHILRHCLWKFSLGIAQGETTPYGYCETHSTFTGI